jgi:excisionase family DNA binding protein
MYMAVGSVLISGSFTLKFGRGGILEINPTSIYTYEQVQEILGVKKTVMVRLIKEGLKPVRLGKSYRFWGEELLRFLRSKQAE